MVSSVMLRHAALVRTDDSEKHIASIIRVTRIGELGLTFAVIATEAGFEEILAECVGCYYCKR
jgi:demethoxyubiquinone hydroxylase (CLK1/Coq7/Cat5 family)